MNLPALSALAARPWVAGAGAVLALTLAAVVVWALARVARTARRLPGEVRMAALGAAVCTAYSGDTSWRFARDHLGMTDTVERAVMFGAGEAALIALAVVARANKRTTATEASAGSAGVAGALVWCITAVQIVPAFAESGVVGGLVRAVFGPVMAGMLWHLAMGLEIRIGRPAALSTGLLAVVGREVRERLLSYLGLAARDRTAEQIARDRAMARAVRLASRPKRSAWARRRLAAAVARARVGTDGAQRHRLLQELAARRSAEELATVPLPSPWASTPVLAEPYPRTPLGVTGAQLRAMHPLDAVLQVHAAHPDATAAELASLCIQYGVPVTQTQVQIALRAATEPPVPAVPAPASPRTAPEHGDPVPVPAGGLVLDFAPAANLGPMAAPVPVPGSVLALMEGRVPEPSTEGSVDDLIARAREIDAEHRARKGRPASIRVLKRHLRIGQPKAEMVRAALTLEDSKP